ncbi:signal peptidase II [Herpetosiphon geysericola]|uniref:Lipoprotein signal peptidase n=1 Tax=Herpetosiphon geysericola TaxID=70996 RepID=A0A0P6XRP3_9CHLR|nr:signal peptidase II [Herpetosiphon geysericola]KPL79457.1 hypothetical protein SE18_26195 [Herpetosiphon geysericola]
MKLTKRYSGFAAMLVAILALDRWVKWWTLDTLTPVGNPGTEPIPGILRFVYVENRGVAFGFLENNSLLLGILALGVIGFVLFRSRTWFRDAGLLGQTAVVAIIAGGLGNIIDRFAYGFVVDTFHIIPLPIFQVFNIADMAISFGAVSLFITLWREDAAKRRSQQTA